VELSTAVMMSGVALDAVLSLLALLKILTCHRTTIYRHIPG
jgi:hypothetical protein